MTTAITGAICNTVDDESKRLDQEAKRLHVISRCLRKQRY
jgi:hypothetical protein